MYNENKSEEENRENEEKIKNNLAVSLNRPSEYNTEIRSSFVKIKTNDDNTLKLEFLELLDYFLNNITKKNNLIKSKNLYVITQHTLNYHQRQNSIKSKKNNKSETKIEKLKKKTNEQRENDFENILKKVNLNFKEISEFKKKIYPINDGELLINDYENNIFIEREENNNFYPSFRKFTQNINNIEKAFNIMKIIYCNKLNIGFRKIFIRAIYEGQIYTSNFEDITNEFNDENNSNTENKSNNLIEELNNDNDFINTEFNFQNIAITETYSNGAIEVFNNNITINTTYY